MTQEVYVEAATFLLTAEQRDWVNSKTPDFGDRGAAVRALINEQIRHEHAVADFMLGASQTTYVRRVEDHEDHT